MSLVAGWAGKVHKDKGAKAYPLGRVSCTLGI